MEGKNISSGLKIAAGQFVREKKYWTNQLSGEAEKCYFPYDNYKESIAGEYPKNALTFKISGDCYMRLMEITGGSYPKIHMIFVACVVALSAQYTGNQDIIVGTSIEKQDIEESLINTILPLRVSIPNQIAFKDLIIEIRKVINEAIEHQNYPIETLMPQQEKLIDTIVLLENIQEKKYVEHLHAALTFSFRECGNEVAGELEYDTTRYEMISISRIIEHFMRFVNMALFDVNRRVGDFDIISRIDREELLRFNSTSAPYPYRKTIHELFELQVDKAPENIAVIENGNPISSLSYRLLNEKANRWSRILVNQGVKPNDMIGILMESSIEMICAILAILKSGGVFLPIDVEYPNERKLYMLKDSKAVLLLTQKSMAEPISWTGKIIYIEDIESDNKVGEVGVESIRVHPKDPAYLIYTSGTTGLPKGVLVEHRSLVNYVFWAVKSYVKDEIANFPLYTSIAFDLTITSLFTPLITGNTLFIYRGTRKEFLIDKVFDDNKVEVVKITPTHLIILSNRGGKIPNIKRFIVGGEKLDIRLAQNIHEQFDGNIEIYNEYGPTEATVGCMIYKFNPQLINRGSVPIGSPSDNMKIYLLDKNMREVPIGGIGEIHISGDGLARGYLNRPGLTAERFLSNPFEHGQRMFKTGDLARRSENAILEFIGRADQQVKIRGYRIEIGEVESCLAKYENIKQVVLVAKEDKEGYQYLVAYIVPTDGKDKNSALDTGKLRDYVATYLPEFMIPSYFVQLDKLPVNSNGKIDRNALPEPPKNALDIDSQYRPPTTELEKIMTSIWQEVLGVDRVGLDDSYFSLGGDSIKAILISARVQKFNLKLELTDLFQYPTIAGLIPHVKTLIVKANQGIIEGEVKLTPIQKWFFQQNLTEMHHFNQSVLLHRQEGFEKAIVEKAFRRIVEHHDALRMIYLMKDGEIKQINRGVEPALLELVTMEISGESDEKVIAEACNQIQAGMDLSRGPLVKLGLFNTGNGDYLLIAIHHLIIDTVSFRILLEDFSFLYQQIEQGMEDEKIEMPLKSTSYLEWSEKLYEYANSETILRELKYWQSLEKAGVMSLLEQTKKPRSTIKDSKGLSFELSEADTDKLLKQVNKAYNTEINDILLAGLGMALSHWTGGEQISTLMEGHGREEIIPGVDITRTVGWFTSVYPVVLDMRNRHDISSVIKNTKETLRNIPAKGIGYGILKYLTNEDNKQGIEFCLNPRTSFNYLGQVDEDINTRLFQPARISGGNSTSLNSEWIYSLYITGLVFKGQLKMNVSYSPMEYREEQIRDFVNSYKKYLQQIIDHCSGQQETELTASDLGTAIDQEEADLAFDVLSEITLNE